MATSERKAREREAREALILDAAERLLEEHGYLGLNMDRIAEATDYSKGTIYQHFSCKEEVMAAIIDRLADIRIGFFERAATFRGNSRERMAAVGLSLDLFAVLYPQHFRLEQIVTADSIRAKTPESRLEKLRRKESTCQNVVAGIVRDAIAAGDLELPEGFPPEALVFGLWMTTYGGLAILSAMPDLEHMGIRGDPHAIIRHTQNTILDAHGWKPLFEDFDYEASRVRAMREVFPDEARRAGLLD